jgi:acyl-CoA reductase-like NAD-dependent aldehyde dehydrogenase
MEKLKIKYTDLFINGCFVKGKKNGIISVINPATEENIIDISEATEEDIDLAVEAAESGFKVWSDLPIDERVNSLNLLADDIKTHLEEYAQLEALDNGKPYIDAIEDIKEVIRVIRYYAGFVDKVFGQTLTTYDDLTICTRRLPYGIVGCIVPWNYPLLMAAWKIFPALSAGNAIVLKPSEETPLTAIRLGQSLIDVGFPKGVINIVTGYGKTAGDAITHHNKINKVAFTGSTNVGRNIMKASADSNLKNIHLELGGKSPLIIFADSDIDLAVSTTLDGAFRNTSQNCCCSSRIFVEESIYDIFVQKLVDETKKIKVGSFTDEMDTYPLAIGPLINKRQHDKCFEYIETGKTEGLKLVCGGTRPEELKKGYFISPTIFIHVPDTSKLAREEIFAPVLCILKPFKSAEEVLKRANDTTYGLAAGVFTSNMNRAEYFVRNLQAGTIWVNFYNATNYNVPFGGMKQSGFGRDNGSSAIEEYTTTKAVYIKNDFSKI